MLGDDNPGARRLTSPLGNGFNPFETLRNVPEGGQRKGKELKGS